MVTTCKSYIEEYRLFDDVFDCLNEATREVEIAMGNFNMKMHQLQSKMFFEASSDQDYQAMMEAEGEGVLAKIGNAVMKLIQTVTGFIKKITDKITGNIKAGKSDEEKVNQLLAQHPELKNHVVEGIDKKWFTVSDVAKYEKDVLGLIQMLNKNVIDHQTFMDKFKDACKRFADSAAPILAATTTVIGFMKVIPDVHKNVSNSKKALCSFNDAAKKFKTDIDSNYSQKDVSKANAIMYAIKQAIGLTTSECKHQVENQGRISKVLGWIGKIATFDTAKSKNRAQIRNQAREDADINKAAAEKNAARSRQGKINEESIRQRGQTSLFSK